MMRLVENTDYIFSSLLMEGEKMRVIGGNSIYTFKQQQMNHQPKEIKEVKDEGNTKIKTQKFYNYLEKSNLDIHSLNQINYAYTNAEDFINGKGQNLDAPLLSLNELKNTLSQQENSLTLAPGTKIKLSPYTSPEVYVTVERDSVTISTDKTPLGSAYVDTFNKTVRKMLNVSDSNEIPDLSKLSKEDLAIVKQMQKHHTDAVKGIGGDDEYHLLHTIAESLDNFIRFANEQSPWVAIENHEEVKLGLEMMGIDTNQPFYVNGSKLKFDEDGLVRKVQEG
ncbi:hypothetical protein ACE1TI_18860 [Alteribacillus sp. JSM 102045]